MASAKSKLTSRLKRKRRIRKKISGTASMPRLAVFRSARHISAQLIDDEKGITLASASSQSRNIRDRAAEFKGKTEIAKHVGMELADAGRARGIEIIAFDRGGFLYHGRVKALAEGAREGGLKF